MRRMGRGEYNFSKSQIQLKKSVFGVCRGGEAASTHPKNGSLQIVAGKVEQGLAMVQEAQVIFESRDSDDHKQGVGWCWILRADLINAGLVAGSPLDVIAVADRALVALQPIENWPGVARAYAAPCSCEQVPRQ